MRSNDNSTIQNLSPELSEYRIFYNILPAKENLTIGKYFESARRC